MTALRKTRRDGYTLIEVMMAVGVLMVGAVGIFAMQQASTRANVEARQMTVANNVARTWAERLRRDQIHWRASGGGVALAQTDYLQLVPAGMEPGPWITPEPVLPQESYGFDWYGRDTRAEAEITYCTNIKLRWLQLDDAIRADIRVWWVRNRSGDARVIEACAPGAEADATAEIGPGLALRAVHLSTILHWVGER